MFVSKEEYMSKKDYRRAFTTAKRELHDLLTKRGEIDKRIDKLKTTIDHLGTLCGDESNLSAATLSSSASGMGITELIRLALKHATEPMKPKEVARQVHAWRPDLDQNHNLLASTHTVLKRLVNGGEAEAVPALGRKKAYKWISEVSRALKGVEYDKGKGFSE
jgi:hypothetical protein